MKRNPITLVTGAVLVLIFGFMLFSYQVRQTEVAVVTTFGKYSRSVTDPGFRLRWPWPIEKVYEFDNRLQTFESKYDPSLTKDSIQVQSQVYVGWKIADPQIFLNRFDGDVQQAERTLEPIVRNAKTEVISSHAFSNLVSTNTAELRFDQLEEEMLTRIREQSEGIYGVEVQMVGFRRLGLPESTTGTVFQRMRAERQRLVRAYQTEGEKEAKMIQAAADGQANEILAEAEGQAIRIRGDAEKVAQEHYRIFEKKPELAVFLFQLKALEESLKDRTHLILDQQTAPLNLLGERPSASGSNTD